MISDAQFESMGLAIGQIGMMKALFVAEDKAVGESKDTTGWITLFKMGLRL